MVANHPRSTQVDLHSQCCWSIFLSHNGALSFSFFHFAFVVRHHMPLQLELVFVVRDDMLPSQCQSGPINLELTDNLTLSLVSGTYGETLDPNFDCGSGSPDMIMGLNAGLFAYESWRSVVDYLFHSKGVVGFFTDYNEHSCVHCAAIGGGRDTVCINPFRQPLAMPVYSMNLPQFSNGWIYVFNEQNLDE